MKKLDKILSCFTVFTIAWMLGNSVQVQAYGITAIGDEHIHQNSSGIQGGAETSDEFGHAIVAGDFDADGNEDLAIGIPSEDIKKNTLRNGGAVQILYGSNSGITRKDKIYTGITPEANDEFGYALATGDFNRDGASDLAIGVPNKNVSGVDSAGQVIIYFGLKDYGLVKSNHQILNQAGSHYKGKPEWRDRFGRVLATGDFDGDKFTDLAVGVPYEDVSNNRVLGGGAVQVFYGSEQGFTDRDQLFVMESPQKEEHFGASLAAGDFNGDGYSDLAIGSPDRDVSGAEDSGAVLVMYGEKLLGLSHSSAQFVSQHLSGISGTPESGDHFGHSLAAGDFDGDGNSELAIGVPYEDINKNTILKAGTVHVLSGRSAGLALGWDKVLSQLKTTSGSAAEHSDLFGYSLVVGNFNGDEFNDLAVGVPGEKIANNTINSGGAVQIFYGSPYQGVTKSDEIWSQDSLGIKGEPESGDNFGLVLASGDFDGDKITELVVGVPLEDLGSGKDIIVNAGSINILKGGPPEWLNGSEAVARLSFDNELDIEDSIRYRLDDNIQGGYQFGLMQSGKVVNSYAVGDATISTTPMETDMRMNIGSISKMIMTITALKMADQGFFDLADRIGPFLANHGASDMQNVAVHSTVANITIYELLTHTGRLLELDTNGDGNLDELPWRTALSSQRMVGACDFSIPVNPGEQAPCRRRYQNNNTRILRYVIESALGHNTDPDEHPPALVEYIQNLWLNDIGAGEVSCSANPNVTYYPANIQYSNSKSCSAGGWKASSENWFRIMRYLSYGQILSDEMTELLYDKTLTTSTGRTAMGWDWGTLTSDEVLTKNGGIPNDFNSCIGHFDQGVEMVLLLNEDILQTNGVSMSACTVLRNAWRAINDLDRDGDGIADSLDAFPWDRTETTDTDSDGTGDNADTDDDNDGFVDWNDAFPLDPKEWVDTDGDGIGDNHDRDDDGNGIPDDEEGGRGKYKL